MGRIVDSLVVSVGIFFVFLVSLLYAGQNAHVSAFMALLAAFCAFVLISYALKKTPRLSFHRRRTQAAKRVRSLIYDTAERAHRTVFALLKCRYPVSGERFEGGQLRFLHEYDPAALYVLQKLRATPDDVLKVWREQGAGREISALIVAVPGRSDSDIRVLASRLTHPDVVILDRTQLMKMTRRYGNEETPSASVRSLRGLKALQGYVSRRRAGRYLIYAALLTAYYILTGRAFYLAAGLLMGYMACFCLGMRREPDRLIDKVSPAHPDESGNPRGLRDRSQSDCQ